MAAAVSAGTICQTVGVGVRFGFLRRGHFKRWWLKRKSWLGKKWYENTWSRKIKTNRNPRTIFTLPSWNREQRNRRSIEVDWFFRRLPFWILSIVEKVTHKQYRFSVLGWMPQNKIFKIFFKLVIWRRPLAGTGLVHKGRQQFRCFGVLISPTN